MIKAFTTSKPKYNVIHDVEKSSSNKDIEDDVTVATVLADDDDSSPSQYKDYPQVTYVGTTATATSPMIYKPHRSTTKKGGCCRVSCCCIFGWCTCCSIFCCFILLPLIMLIGMYSMTEYGIDFMTVDTPVTLPIVNDVSYDEFMQFYTDIAAFYQAIKQVQEQPSSSSSSSVSAVSKSTTSNKYDNMMMTFSSSSATRKIPDLIIPSRILNGFMYQYFDVLRGNVYITVNTNECILQTSLPLDELHLPFHLGEHRYYVSTTDVHVDDAVDVVDGTTHVTMSLDLGKQLSDDYDGPLLVSSFLLYYQDTMINNKPKKNENHHFKTMASKDKNPFHHVSKWMMKLVAVQWMGEDEPIDDTYNDVDNANFVQAFINGWDNGLKKDVEKGKVPNVDQVPDISLIFNSIESISFQPNEIIVRARTP